MNVRELIYLHLHPHKQWQAEKAFAAFIARLRTPETHIQEKQP